MAEEKDQETTNASASGDASPRQPYRSLLTRLHADGELDDAGYADRSAEVDAATTWGDLESAISGLDRGGLAVPTRRRQRRELPEEPTEPDRTGHTDSTDTDDEIDVDVDEDDVELDEDDEDLGVDEDVDDDELDLDEDETDDDESEDREAGELDDEADLDDLDDDEDLDDLDDDEDLDDEDVPARKRGSGKAVATTSGKGAGAAARSGRSQGRRAKGRPTPKRPSAVKEPTPTGPVQFVKESIEELRKVVYPTSSQLGTYFVVVLVFVLFVIGFTSGLDYGFGQLVLLVFG